MTLEMVRSFFLWCAIINFGVLMYWFLVFAFARDWLHRVHGRWFRLSVEQFDAVHYVGLTVFKVGVILFNLVPYVALLIVG
jgi:hypothetical protein